ncbi:ribosome maturation factor RimP [Legionella hackeliae]|uniref:Ribosome maturation factor RimP n=1 Tax=Legionella hackeliae TaxID=449 RepID=A0A0A8USX8_LEGHA|nr:ribosome maturation factor RimP [Legionella hackeliae]KTD12555.1 Ribosome maturation factor RimP [Legionella hackeliae]CEK11970.1 Ribosome maturation factor rimP [Legionella hackeliae]STX48750.1 NusA-like protein [Legionella hackeliae]
MIKSEIEQLLKPLIEDLEYELWGCEYLSQGKHSLLRIYIDKENGIGIEDCERVSKQISALLDVEDPISGNYSLEISSPGIPRPLFYKEQYERYIGHDVQIKVFKPINGSRKLSGTIISTDEDTLILKIGDKQLEVQFSQIVKANLTGE